MFKKQREAIKQFFTKIEAVREYVFDLRKERKWLMDTNRELAGIKERLAAELEEIEIKKAAALGNDTRTAEERAK